MKTKYLIVVLIGFMNMNTSNAQEDEVFLAEAFFGGMTKKDSKVYVSKYCGMPLFFHDYEEFYEKFGISDSTVVDELYEYYEKASENQCDWNPDATVFQSPNYKPLKFVTSEKAAKLDKKGKHVIHISKPLYTKNHEYALIFVTHYSCHKYSWRYRLSVKPWKNIWKAKYEYYATGRNILFKRTNGKWEKVGEYITQVS